MGKILKDRPIEGCTAGDFLGRIDSLLVSLDNPVEGLPTESSFSEKELSSIS